MNKKILFLLMLVFCISGVKAQKHEFANWKRYEKANKELGEPGRKEKRVVLMGNSITDGWPGTRPDFFKKNKLIGRGIGGQTTSHMLVRFRRDVIELNPRAVVIMAGINDIALNNGKITHENILGNIISMCELAKFHKIRPVLCSCLPAASFKWRPDLTPAEDIKRLNEMIKAYAKANKILYVDYYSAFVDEQGGLPTKYAKDGVHPNLEAYKIMEQILLRYL